MGEEPGINEMVRWSENDTASADEPIRFEHAAGAARALLSNRITMNDCGNWTIPDTPTTTIVASGCRFSRFLASTFRWAMPAFPLALFTASAVSSSIRCRNNSDQGIAGWRPSPGSG